jgi:hypothetical protein
LISVTTQRLGNKYAAFGNRYNIQLNGVIYEPSDSVQQNFTNVLDKQKELVNIFEVTSSDTDPIKLELTPGGDNPKLSFYVRLESISFEDGTYADGFCRYTINLVSEKEVSVCCEAGSPEDHLLEDLNESWSFDLDSGYGYGERPGMYSENVSPRSYIFTRTVTATGRNSPQKYISQSVIDSVSTSPDTIKDKPAWLQAEYFLSNSNYNSVSSILANNPFTGDLFPKDISLQAFNHARTFSVDKGAGSCTITDTFVLARSGSKAIENYTMNIGSSRDAPYVKVSIDGSIKGLSNLNYDNLDDNGNNDIYSNAQDHYLAISGTGSFGANSTVYKRASAAVGQTLNTQPLSVSLGTNQVTGEITYNIEFDNRPSNFFSNALYENISINDTYPGDVFATIPVLGRPTGPILQFTFGRTEYKRDISIEILVDYTNIGYNADRTSLLLRKPSINEPIRSELNTLIQYLSPINEPGIRKYFLSPPSESWNPKEGRYTLSLGWTYELSE